MNLYERKKLYRIILVPCLAIWFLGISLTSQIAFGSLFESTPLYAQSNEIVTENQNSGTTEWQLTNSADDVNLQMKGYASATSVSVGGSIDFYVTVSSTQNFTATIYRMGWYQGTGGREIATMGPIQGTTQPAPIIDMTPPNHTGRISAENWGPKHTLNIGTDWISGVYLAKLKNDDGYENYIKFVVRDDSRTADFLYHHADATDQAYNRYPRDNATGKSTYTGWGGNTVAGNQRAVKVSFDRPFESDGSGQFFRWEYPLIRWLEKEGYDVTYASNMDTHTTGTGAGNYLRNYKAILSAGHDEYFSKEMFDAFEDARDNGVHLAFFGANAVYWQVRFEDSDRTLVVYKSDLLDPETNPALETDKFRDVGRPEQQLIGVQYDKFNNLSDASIYTDYVVQNSDHWVYSCTGLNDNDTVPKLVGYEVDRDFGVSPPAQANSHVYLSSSPFVGTSGTVNAQSSIYQATSGAWVFASGTMNWSLALGDGSTILDYSGMPTTLIDARIQKVTANVLNTFLTYTPLGGSVQQWEAESGTGFGNYTIGIDLTGASNGKYIHFPTGYGGGTAILPNHPNFVEYCFAVTQAGTYQITARTFALSGNNDSFLVQVDGQPTGGHRWNLPGPYNTYVDGVISGFDVTLGPGEHTIRVTQREKLARLDQIGLTLQSPLFPPGQVTLELPTGTIATTEPIFQWQGDSTASEYWLVVYNETTGQIAHSQESITAESAGCSGGGTCTLDLGLSLTAGNAYRWLIQAANVAGPGPWSTYP